MLKDEKLIVFHDEVLGRTVSGEKSVAKCLWTDLVNSDAGVWKGEKFKGETVPSLSKALSWANENNVKLILEMKCYGTRQKRSAKVLANFLSPWQNENLIVSSFDINFLRCFRRQAPKMRLARIHREMPQDIECLATTLSLEAVHLDVDFVLSKSSVKEFHGQGLKVRAWKVNDLFTPCKLLATGVDMVMSDCPQILLEK